MSDSEKRQVQAAAPDSERAAQLRLLETWVDEHSQALFRYVLPRVRDRHVAEELVQETFLAAIKAIASFRAKSGPRTWLIGLLRRKIADHYRRRYREGTPDPADRADPGIDAWFNRKGSWVAWPKPVNLDPAVLRSKADFWAVFETCLRTLPTRLAEAFTLRVMDDRPAGEVCKILSMSATNLWVALHRARARLRACLETKWFRSDSPGQE